MFLIQIKIFIYLVKILKWIYIYISDTCQGDLIMVGPGGDGYQFDQDNFGGNGGIGSAIINQTNLTFLGQNYTYSITIPKGWIPSWKDDIKKYSSQT